jgi:hypothetical protein
MDDDHDIHERVSRLVDREHRLRSGPIGEEARGQLSRIEEQLDQCWDLLRQRQALRDAGGAPDQAHERPADEVEGYLQ